MKVRIRLAGEEHIPGVVEVWKGVMDFHQAKDPFFTRKKGAEKDFSNYFREVIAADDMHALVAYLNKEQVIGFSISAIKSHPPVFTDTKYGEIIDLAIRDDYRCLGIGEEMLKIVFEWFDAHNANRVELRVAAMNMNGYSFWEKHGFVESLHVLQLDRGA
jgi:ribosomal protein S18 acetylase RimI-like enzyme